MMKQKLMSGSLIVATGLLIALTVSTDVASQESPVAPVTSDACVTLTDPSQKSSSGPPTSGVAAGDSGKFFPEDFSDDPFLRRRYLKRLAVLQAPPLNTVAPGSGAEILRIVVLPSFFPAYAIRVDRSGDIVTVTKKQLKWERGRHEDVVVAIRSREVPLEMWDRLSNLASALWAMGDKDPEAAEIIGFDGREWIFESVEDGQYCRRFTHEWVASLNARRLMGLLHEAAEKPTLMDLIAERTYQLDLENREKLLGPGHPGVAHSLYGLAELYRRQGRYTEAEPLYRRLLAIREKALGPDHPDVAMSLEGYAELLRETGRKKLAEELKARVRAIGAANSDESDRD